MDDFTITPTDQMPKKKRRSKNPSEQTTDLGNMYTPVDSPTMNSPVWMNGQYENADSDVTIEDKPQTTRTKLKKENVSLRNDKAFLMTTNTMLISLLFGIIGMDYGFDMTQNEEAAKGILVAISFIISGRISKLYHRENDNARKQ